MVDTVSSPSITALDAYGEGPIVAGTAGAGAPRRSLKMSDYVAATAAGLGSTSSKYKVVRLPTNVTLQSLIGDSAVLDSSGSPTLAVNVGAYYSDSTVDGTPAALQGTVISATQFGSSILFGAAADRHSIDFMPSITQANKQVPLWQACGLASDPGGFIDIVVAVEAAAATAAAGQFQVTAEFSY